MIAGLSNYMIQYQNNKAKAGANKKSRKFCDPSLYHCMFKVY